jgi:hypothetical protein
MVKKKTIFCPAINITPADVIEYCATRRQKPTTSEAERWLRKHRAEIEEEIRLTVNLRLDQILDSASIAEYPDPRVNEKHRIVDSAIAEALNRHCEMIGKEDYSSFYDGTVMLDVLQHLLDSGDSKGMICMPYTVEYVDLGKSAEDQAVTHQTNRVHIVHDKGNLIAEVVDHTECDHDGSVFSPISKDS